MRHTLGVIGDTPKLTVRFILRWIIKFVKRYIPQKMFLTIQMYFLVCLEHFLETVLPWIHNTLKMLSLIGDNGVIIMIIIIILWLIHHKVYTLWRFIDFHYFYLDFDEQLKSSKILDHFSWIRRLVYSLVFPTRNNWEFSNLYTVPWI